MSIACRKPPKIASSPAASQERLQNATVCRDPWSFWMRRADACWTWKKGVGVHVNLTHIPVDNHFHGMTAGGTAQHRAVERHINTLQLSFCFPAPPPQSHLRQLPLSLSHPFITGRRCRQRVCVCLRDVLTRCLCASFNEDLYLMTNASGR